MEHPRENPDFEPEMPNTGEPLPDAIILDEETAGVNFDVNDAKTAQDFLATGKTVIRERFAGSDPQRFLEQVITLNLPGQEPIKAKVDKVMHSGRKNRFDFYVSRAE